MSKLNFHCLFEQSSTFKNVFKSYGHNAFDYDILNDFGETDYQIDLFAEIEKEYDNIVRGGNMKQILISIKPEWVAKILNGDKTIEVRKTMPNCELPVKVYIYCTKGDKLKLYKNANAEEWFLNEEGWRGGVYENRYLSGKVVAEFTLNKVGEIETVHRGYEIDGTIEDINSLSKKSGLDFLDLRKYLDYKKGYAWYIDDLVIYDEPKELKEFNLNTAPQSWFYVEKKL